MQYDNPEKRNHDVGDIVRLKTLEEHVKETGLIYEEDLNIPFGKICVIVSFTWLDDELVEYTTTDGQHFCDVDVASVIKGTRKNIHENDIPTANQGHSR